MYRQADVTWWRKKVARVGSRCFGPGPSRWAVHIYDQLLTGPDMRLTAPTYQSLAELLPTFRTLRKKIG